MRITTLLTLLLLPASTLAFSNPFGSSATKKQTARAPLPSRRMGKATPLLRGLKARNSKPKAKNYSGFLCPDNKLACPIAPPSTDGKQGVLSLQTTPLDSLGDWFKVGFECLDPNVELGSCGGCTSLGKGQDCTSIPHMLTSSCVAGKCVLESCEEGYAVSGKICLKLPGTGTGNARRMK